MHSLRSKLVSGILGGVTLLLAVGGTAAYFAIKERLDSEFDRVLVRQAVLMAAMIEQEAGEINVEWLEDGTIPPAERSGVDYFAVWTNPSREPLAASPGLDWGILPRFGGSFAHPELRDVVLPGGRVLRCAGIEFDAHRGLREDDVEASSNAEPDDVDAASDAPLVQLVIAKLDTVAPTLVAIRKPLIGLWMSCTVLGAAMIWITVGRSLRPLGRLTAQIERLKEGRSGQRVALVEQPAELEPVTRELNRLLERVEQTLWRERTLTSNVAHELRTPIAGLLSTLEVTLNCPRSPEEYRESSEECFEIAKRMNWLVNNLLSIARIEAGNVQLQNHDVMIGNVLTEWWKPFETRAAERGLNVDWQIETAARIETDPEFFRVVVTNLFDNAVSYAPEGGTIRIEANSGAISVANQAKGLDAEVINRAFDPFWRSAETRDAEVAHAGLGLNLCRKIIELLGGRISAHIKQPESLFVVRLEMV